MNLTQWLQENVPEGRKQAFRVVGGSDQWGRECYDVTYPLSFSLEYGKPSMSFKEPVYYLSALEFSALPEEIKEKLAVLKLNSPLWGHKDMGVRIAKDLYWVWGRE
jgi:hypothetical protein